MFRILLKQLLKVPIHENSFIYERLVIWKYKYCGVCYNLKKNSCNLEKGYRERWCLDYFMFNGAVTYQAPEMNS